MISWTAKEVKAGWWFYASLTLYETPEGPAKINTSVLIPRSHMKPETAWECIANMQAAINKRREEHEASHA